jgi:hypothetical protein
MNWAQKSQYTYALAVDVSFGAPQLGQRTLRTRMR